MKVEITDFKAHCMAYFRELEQKEDMLEVTRRGETIAVIRPAAKKGCPDCWGGLRGTVQHLSEDFDVPEGDRDWEAAQ